MIKKIIFVILVSFFVTACKSTKNKRNTDSENMLLTKVLSKYNKNSFDKKTIRASIKAKYKGKESLPSVSISLRIKKDKVIWMSISKIIGIGKLKITPKRVQFYNKLTNEYFDGDFALLSNFLGTEVTFNQIQDILLGQAIYKLDIKNFNIKAKENSFIFTPKNKNEIFDILFQLDASVFKLLKQEIAQKNKILTINYSDYEKIKGVYFPKNIFVKAIKGKSQNTVNITYRKVIFDEKLNFPFKIPNGYKEIKL